MKIYKKGCSESEGEDENKENEGEDCLEEYESEEDEDYEIGEEDYKGSSDGEDISSDGEDSKEEDSKEEGSEEEGSEEESESDITEDENSDSECSSLESKIEEDIVLKRKISDEPGCSKDLEDGEICDNGDVDERFKKRRVYVDEEFPYSSTSKQSCSPFFVIFEDSQRLERVCCDPNYPLMVPFLKYMKMIGKDENKYKLDWDMSKSPKNLKMNCGEILLICKRKFD